MINLEALLYAVLGGVCFGTYPLFIRTPAALAAKPHPIVFQLYKSTVVFLSSFLFLLPRYVRWHAANDGTPLFVFNWWGVASAALWIPAGLTTIWSVPIIGMGLQVAVAASSSAVVSFCAFWLLFGTKMKEHSCGGTCVYYLAPLYLFFTVMGMVTLIFSEKVATLARQHCCTLCRLNDHNAGPGNYQKQVNVPEEGAGEESNHGANGPESTRMVHPTTDPASLASRAASVGRFAMGILMSVVGGISASAQFAVIQQGKKYEQVQFHCVSKNITCPPKLVESFDTFGSWMVSFGFGAFGITVLLFGGLAMWQGRCPLVHWDVLKIAGVKAGCFWVLGNLGTTLAVVRGGNAVVLSQALSTMIITSGFWGLLWYKEGDLSLLRRFVWFLAAVCTVVSMILLGMEKLNN